MKIERDQVFRELEPPPGGAARLRASLAASRPRSWRPAVWLGPGALALIAAAAFFVLRLDPSEGPSAVSDSLLAAASFDRLLGRESAPYELRVTRGTMPVAVNEIRSNDPNVRIYSLDVE